MSSKAALRRRFQALRARIPQSERQAAGLRLADMVANYSPFARARHVAGFASHGHEIATDALLDRLRAQGRRVLLPRVDKSGDNTMVFCDYSRLEDLPTDRFGIRSPDGEAFLGPLDLVFLPGLAFARNGGRLGYGAGFYDRHLSQRGFASVPLCGLAYDGQVVGRIPVLEHDVPVTHIATPTEVIVCDPS